jgi:type III restriction enzyme
MNKESSLVKAAAAATWGKHATEHARQHGAKPWSYLLIPHDVIAENMTLAGLAAYTRKAMAGWKDSG